MRIVITGADGNVGGSLQQKLSLSHDVIGTVAASGSRQSLDVTDMEAVTFLLSQYKPDLVVHCAALTNVDQCAEDPDRAMLVNAVGTQNVALACQTNNIAMCYISTNEVFDGLGSRQYMEYDPTNPGNPYAYSKWVGERIVAEILPRHYIVRTAWLFAHTGTNFVHKVMARANAGEPLSVVIDEVGSPTYVEDLTDALVALLVTRRYGTYHLVNEGSCSRYDFARHLLDVHGLTHVPIAPMMLRQFSRPSTPPPYTPLRNFMAAQLGIRLRDWRDAVKAFVERDAFDLSISERNGRSARS